MFKWHENVPNCQRFIKKCMNLCYDLSTTCFWRFTLKYGEKKDNELQFVAHYLFILFIGYHGTR